MKNVGEQFDEMLAKLAEQAGVKQTTTCVVCGHRMIGEGQQVHYGCVNDVVADYTDAGKVDVEALAEAWDRGVRAAVEQINKLTEKVDEEWVSGVRAAAEQINNLGEEADKGAKVVKERGDKILADAVERAERKKAEQEPTRFCPAAGCGLTCAPGRGRCWVHDGIG